MRIAATLIAACCVGCDATLALLDTAVVYADGASVRALQAVTLTVNIPPVGSLGAITGNVSGLAAPQDSVFCVYLESVDSGVALLWV